MGSLEMSKTLLWAYVHVSYAFTQTHLDPRHHHHSRSTQWRGVFGAGMACFDKNWWVLIVWYQHWDHSEWFYSVNTFPSSDNRAVTSVQTLSVISVRGFCFDLTVKLLLKSFWMFWGQILVQRPSWDHLRHSLTFVLHWPNLFSWLLWVTRGDGWFSA